MRALRLFFTRRWLAFLLVVVLLSYLAWWLGEWQFHRLSDRQQRNSVIERNYDAAPVPVEQVLELDRPVPSNQEYRRVQATGTYDPAGTIVVRYRTRDSASGVDVVVPLHTPQGAVLLVDRGWLATDNSAAAPEDLPPPPTGTVTVIGRVRQDATGSETKVSNGSTRAISSRAIGAALGVPTYRGFVELDSEDPAADTPLTPAEAPDLGEGPHFFYGLQWWFFGALAVFGFGYLFYDELRKAQQQRSMPPSTGSITPETYDAAGDNTNAATRPNSSGVP